MTPVCFVLRRACAGLAVAILCASLTTPVAAQDKRPARQGDKPKAVSTPAAEADAPEMGPYQKPQPGETVEAALADIQAKLSRLHSMKATLAMDREHEREKKKGRRGLSDLGEKPGRRIHKGPLEMIRGAGARLVLSRRDSHEFYVANAQNLWSYDVGDKEAKKIPTTLPVIEPLVQAAFSLNAAASMEPGSIKLRGSQTVDGVDCWIISGTTPKRLEMLGVESYKIGFWVGKTDGIPRRILVPDNDDTIITLRDITIDPTIDPTRFQWTPPAGVKAVGILGF